jgi:hypothetical protein
MSSTPKTRLALAAAAAIAALAAAAGCTSTTSSAGASATPTQAAATSAPATSSAPALGQPAGDFVHGTGFGQVKPPTVYNGGDPTGLVSAITWQSWGGATATGTGTSVYVAGNQPVAAGTEQSATIVAFNLGTCGHRLMYQAVEWYFPQHGQKFSSAHYENVCTGTYVGS